jgi:hypothetical protein
MRSAPANVQPVTATEIARPEKSAKPSRLRFAVLGLYAAHGHAWAEVVPEGEAEQLGHALRERNGRQPIVRPSMHRYTAVVYRGRLYRLAESSAGRTPFGPVEAFWAYLQRQLRGKGGIRRERLGFYLAEFAWRYNHRNVAPAEQVRELLTLIRQLTQV